MTDHENAFLYELPLLNPTPPPHNLPPNLGCVKGCVVAGGIYEPGSSSLPQRCNDAREAAANGQQSGGGWWGSSALDGRDDAGDATSLVLPLLLSSSLSAIAEEHVTGGAPLSADANLNAVPADKEDVIDVDDDGAMVAAVIATPGTMGGDDARETIVLALSSSTRRALTVISLVMNTFFLVLMV
jgi:hypothetical protein